MTTELSKQYDHKEAQAKWLQFWDERGYNHSHPDANREPFTIVIPPPNVTGALHMGHALNNTLQDVLIRWRRMQGYNALYMPGTDHAGIATQAVVERRLRTEEGKTRHDIGREALVQKIWDWKDKYEERILGQLKQLGCSCDWQRTRFTLDEGCSRAVRYTFFEMFEEGLMYRGKRLVNWDTHLQTAVANDEVENVEQKGKFYYFRYPVIESKADGALESVLIGTTRPETMLGDTAVAVHPDPEKVLDKREKELQEELAKANEKEAKQLQKQIEAVQQRREEMLPTLKKLAEMAAKGTTLELPLVGRKMPLIADEYANPEKGTGAVKITPAHDHNDYEVGNRHKQELVEPINILNPDGTINGEGQGGFRGRQYSYVGQDRFEARKKVVEDLQALDLFDRDEEVNNTIPLSDRSKTPVEPYFSDQWFVYMGDRDGKPGLAQMAMDAVSSGQIKFFPDRYAKSYLDWLGEKRDWCVSRQLWWGHRIPIWYTNAPEAELRKVFGDRDDVCWTRDEENDQYLICSKEEDLAPDLFGDKYALEQDPDVLDTWFSSQLWPHSTLGWPEETAELAYYYPTSVLVTNRDIISLWVARMVLAGLFNLGKIPFYHVYIHGTIMDPFGERMSKSKGNGVDPLDIIDRYGTDALRFGAVELATENQDSRMSVANVCPYCGILVPLKQEHKGMRTKKIVCPGDPANKIKCGQAFRPGGPWPEDDPELPTARQASDKFEKGRNFANKLWNAARFLLLNMDGYTPEAVRVEELPIEDKWIVSRLATTTQAITEHLEGYHYSDAARTLYEFTWSEFCDWYLEMSKGRLQEGSEDRALVQRVLVGVLDTILRLAHPIMPFVTESIWQALNEAAFERGLPNPEPAPESVMVAHWPEFPDTSRDEEMELRIGRMQELVRAAREVRNRYMIDTKTSLAVYVRCSEGIAEDFRTLAPFINLLAGVGTLEAGPDTSKPKQAATNVQSDFEMYTSLEGLIDLGKEIERLEKQLAEKQKHLKSTKAKLSNEKFVNNAPAEVVQVQRDQLADLEKQVQSIETNLNELKQS
ncbi:MAG: class I tRNA ligase family protein [Gemmataceae bacterium]